MPLPQHHKGMKIAVSLTFFVGEGFQTLPDIAVRCLFSQEFPMPLSRHHKGMKIAASLAFFRRGGFANPPSDTALPCPYTMFPNHVRELFSEEEKSEAFQLIPQSAL